MGRRFGNTIDTSRSVTLREVAYSITGPGESHASACRGQSSMRLAPAGS